MAVARATGAPARHRDEPPGMEARFGFMLRRSWQHCRLVVGRLDYVLLLCIFVLLAIGCLSSYGTGQQAGGRFSQYWYRQLIAAGIGFGVFAVLALTDYRRLGRWSWAVYAFGLAPLVIVLFWGRTVNSSKSWLPLGHIAMFQPAELAKPATLLLLAWLASRPSLRLRHFHHLLPLLGVVAIPTALIGLQPDWGTALVFIAITVPVVFTAGLAWKWIVVGLLLAVTLAPIGYLYGLAPHQRDRLRTFFDPAADLSDTGWNAHQSLLAVGSGGATGKGFMKGTQNVLGFLPRAVAPTDFVFSVIAEENGFAGASVLLATLALLVGCCLRAAALAADDFGAYLCVGVAALLVVHTYINIGMNIRAAPIIGIPLPLVSYGGSFLLCCLTCLGLVQSVFIRRQPLA